MKHCSGTFPELGGGSGLTLGKDAVASLVVAAGGRVVTQISGQTTHLVIGLEPGAKKLSDAEQRGIAKVYLSDFIALLDAIKRQASTGSATPLPHVNNHVQAATAPTVGQEALETVTAIARGAAVPESQDQVYRHQQHHIQTSFIATQGDGAADANGWLPGRNAFNAAATRVVPAAPAVAAAALAAQSCKGSSRKASVAKAPHVRAATATIVDQEAFETATAIALAAADADPTLANMRKHFELFAKRNWTVVEAGGLGDCFFHSVLLVNQTQRYSTVMPRTHAALRKQVVAHLRAHANTLVVCEQPIAALLRARSPTFLANMKRVGVYVEYEVIGGFAHLINEAVIVYSQQCGTPLVISNFFYFLFCLTSHR